MSKEAFGSYVKRIRLNKKMNLSELSKLSNVSQPYLSQIESGNRTPSPEILEKLAGPLNIPLMDLMYRAGHITEKSYNHYWDIEAGKFEDIMQVKEHLKEATNYIKILSEQAPTAKTQFDKQMVIELVITIKKNLTKFISDLGYSYNYKYIEHKVPELKKYLDTISQIIECDDDNEVKKFSKEIYDNKEEIEKLLDSLYESITSINKSSFTDMEKYFETLHDFSILDEWKRLNYPDIKDILDNNPVYYGGRLLNKQNKQDAYTLLEILFRDLEFNYPSTGDIEKEINDIEKAKTILLNRLNK